MEYGQVLLWWITFQALALLGLPIAALLLPRFVDRGAAFGLPLALVVITTVAYWLGHLRFTWLTLFAAVATLGALAAASVWRGATVEWRKHAEVVVVFTLAFALLVAVRAFDPAITPQAGEKFLDYGLLKSLLRATQLPPQDMWFAGESVQYYYGGHLIAALLAKLTSTPANYAYNLALSGFYAMTVTAAYGLAGAIADEHGVDNRLAGGFAAFFVGFASNVSTPFALLLGALPAGVASTLAGLFGTSVEDFATTPSDFFYWSASRVIEGTINEFPLFAFLNGDMHAHMMSPPFLLLVGALLYGYVRTPATGLSRRRALVFGVVPVVAGLLAVVNTWSWPSALGLTFLSLTFAAAHPLDLFSKSLDSRLVGSSDDSDGWLAAEATRLVGALAGTAVVGLLSVAWVAPFFLNTASGRGIGFFPDRSPMSGLLLVYGAFLATFGLYLLLRAWPASSSPARG
jgi:YYY domain-containing protein